MACRYTLSVRPSFDDSGREGGILPLCETAVGCPAKLVPHCVSESATQKFYNAVKIVPFSETARGMSANQRNEICIEANG